MGSKRPPGKAEVLTVNGEAAVVVQDARSCEALYALAAQARQDERLRFAIEALRNGEPGKPVEEVFAQ